MKNASVCLIGLILVVSASAEPLLEGRVRLESGEPVADAQVRLFDMTDLRQGAIARALTDGTGYFALPLAALGGQALPARFALGPNYPNPFNPSTIIPYQLATSAEVRLEVFNLLGQHIATLVDGERPAGFHTATWTATDAAGRAAAAGVYIYRMTVGVESQTGRMVLVDGQAGVSAAGVASVLSGVAGGGSNGAESQVYGLIVSGEGLAPYVDSSFRVEAGMAPVELVVSSGHSGGKAADDDCAFCDLFDALHDEEEGPGPSGKAQATLEAPPAPTNLRFDAPTDSSCTVRWAAAAGATDYDVNYKPAVGGQWTNEPHRGIRLSNTINDLEPDTAYRWAVRSENGDGRSAWVFGPNFTTLADETDETQEDEGADGQVPAAPTNLRFDAPTDSSCTVRWAAAAGATDYDVNYKPAMGGRWTNEPHRGIGLSNTIDDLQPNTEYRWAVRAENSDGTSAWIHGPNFTTLPEEDETTLTDRWPSAEHPVGESDVAARMAATLFVTEHNRTPPESVRAHPAAADFPGSVPSDAPRLTRTLTIDTIEPRGHSTGLYAAPGEPRRHSTGLYAAPGELVTVTVSARVANGDFFVRVGAHSDDISYLDEWKRMPQISRRFSVSASRTRVANAFGGLIYVEVPVDANLGKITIKIEGAVAAPLFVLGETDPVAWRNEIRYAPAPWAEIAGRNMIVTTDAREVRGLDDPAAVAETWDRVLDLNAELAAWPSPARLRPERFVVDRQIWPGWMHAGYPIMAHLYHQAKVVNVRHLRSPVGWEEIDSNWGIFHEVGHNHQSRDWTFDGTVEVTVNLFTLYVYEFLCGIPVARVYHEWAGDHTRAKIERYDFNNPDFELWKREPGLALFMYVQLQEAFGWDAYRQVFAEYRDLPETERPKSDDEKRDQWLVRFSRQVGHNLGPFFEAWGVPTSKAARNSIADLPVWLPPDFP